MLSIILRPKLCVRLSLRICSNASVRGVHSDVNSDVNSDIDRPRKVLYLNRRIYNSTNITLNILKDLHPKYDFLRVTPPLVNVDVYKVSSIFWTQFASNTNDKHDLIEAWHLLASDPDTLEDDDKEQIIQRLCQSFSNYSYLQLSELLFNLKILYNKPELLKTFFQQLDKALIVKMTNILRSKPTKQDVDDCLKVAFLWLRAQMESNQHHLRDDQVKKQDEGQSVKIQGRHNKTLLNILLKKKLFELTSEQLVFCLFLCGVQKIYPGLSHKNHRGQGFPLPDDLYDKLCQVLPEMTDREVGVLADSLHQSFIFLETRHAEVRQEALKRLINYDDNMIIRDQYTIGSLAKFLKKRGSENHFHSVSAINKFEPHLDDLNSFTVTRLLQFILPGKPRMEESRLFMEKVALVTGGRINEMRLKDLEMLAFGFYFMNHQHLWREMSEKISSAIDNCNWSNVNSGRNFIYLVLHLANMGHFDEANLNKIFDAVKGSEMEDLDTDEGLRKGTKFLFQLNIPFHSHVSQKYVSKHLPTSRLLYRNSLHSLLSLDCLREIYNIDSDKLDPAIRLKLSQFFHSLQQFDFYSSISDFSLDDGFIDCSTNDTFNVRTKAFIHRDLVMILGDEKYIWSGHPFPHSSSSIFILIRDKRGNFIEIPDNFQCFNSKRIFSRQSDHDYTAILVPNKSLIDYKENIFGPVSSTCSQLRQLGYQPLIICWSTYFRELRHRRNLSFLRQKLKRRMRGDSDIYSKLIQINKDQM